jgi:hypothetical protein
VRMHSTKRRHVQSTKHCIGAVLSTLDLAYLCARAQTTCSLLLLLLFLSLLRLVSLSLTLSLCVCSFLSFSLLLASYTSSSFIFETL